MRGTVSGPLEGGDGAVVIKAYVVPVFPAITAQPESRMINAAGASATFTVAATGNPAPAFQWKKNDVNISGATTGTLAFSSVQSADVASYTVVVSNVAGSVTSAAATLNIDTPPTAPANLNYIEKTDRSVSLIWAPSTDNVAVVSYVVYRGVEEKGTTSETVFMETGLPPNTPCVYTVKARDNAGNLSDASNTLNVTTNASSSADSDGDGIPNLVETALGTTASSTSGDPNNQTTQQNVHRPVK